MLWSVLIRGVSCRNGVVLHGCVVPLVAQPGLHTGLSSTCSCRAMKEGESGSCWNFGRWAGKDC